MKYLIAAFLLMGAFVAHGQSVVPLRGDTIKIYKVGGFAELVVQNRTKDSLGVLVNVGNGRTEFRRAKQLDSNHIIIGGDTLSVGGTGGGSGGTDSAIAALYGMKITVVGTTRYLTVDTFQVASRSRLLKVLDSMAAVNDGRFVNKTDSVGPTGYLTHGRGSKIADSLGALINKKVNIVDSAGPGYATFNRLRKVTDSLAALISSASAIDSAFFVGNGIPSSSLGANNNWYWDQRSSFLYRKAAGAWAYKSKIVSDSTRMHDSTFWQGPMIKVRDWNTLGQDWNTGGILRNQDVPGNPDLIYKDDPVHFWGWNVDQNGARIDTTKSYHIWQNELNYQTDPFQKIAFTEDQWSHGFVPHSRGDKWFSSVSGVIRIESLLSSQSTPEVYKYNTKSREFWQWADSAKAFYTYIDMQPSGFSFLRKMTMDSIADGNSVFQFNNHNIMQMDVIGGRERYLFNQSGFVDTAHLTVSGSGNFVFQVPSGAQNVAFNAAALGVGASAINNTTTPVLLGSDGSIRGNPSTGNFIYSQDGQTSGLGINTTVRAGHSILDVRDDLGQYWNALFYHNTTYSDSAINGANLNFRKTYFGSATNAALIGTIGHKVSLNANDYGNGGIYSERSKFNGNQDAAGRYLVDKYWSMVPTGGTNLVDRIKLTNDGNFLIGRTTDTLNAKLAVAGKTYFGDSVNIGVLPTGSTGDSVLIVKSDHTIGKVAQSSISGGGGGPTYTGVAKNWLNANATFVPIASDSLSGSTFLNITALSLGTTQSATKGLYLGNTTAAAAASQQISPGLVWEGQGWKTTATAASQSAKFLAYVLPVQGSANPTATWKLQQSINGGAYTDALTVASNALTTNFTSTGMQMPNGGVSFSGNPAIAMNLLTGGPFTFNYSSALAAVNGFSWTHSNSVITSGTAQFINVAGTFAPTSGTAVYNNYVVAPTINQTGGASGITRGLYINPTLTAAADFRAIDVAAGRSVFAAATTGYGSLVIPTGTAPTSPKEGEIYKDASHAYININSIWYQIDQQSGGGATAVRVSPLDSLTKSSKGIQVSLSKDIVPQTADASFPGLVSTGAQSFAGVKTFASVPKITAMPASAASTDSILAIATDGTIRQTSASKAVGVGNLGTGWPVAMVRNDSALYKSIKTTGGLTITSQTDSTLVIDGSGVTGGQSFAGTADMTIANTTTLTSMVPTGVGASSLAANSLAVGKTVTMKATFMVSTAGGGSTPNIYPYGFGGSITGGPVVLGSVTNKIIFFEAYYTCRATGASGNITGYCRFFDQFGTLLLGEVINETVNTTVSNVVGPWWEWDVASSSNSIVTKFFKLKVE